MFARFVVCTVVSLVALSGYAVENPLTIFPKTTGLVVRSVSPTKLEEAARGFLDNAAPQFSAITGQLAPAMGSMVNNPTLAGVDPERDWFVAVSFRADGPPQSAFIIPSKDTKAMREALGSTVTVKEYDGWLVYSAEEEFVSGLADEALADGESIAGAMSGAAGERFKAGELAIFLNFPSLRDTYKDEIAKAQEQFNEEFDKATAGSAQSIVGAQYYKTFFNQIFRAFEQSTGFVKSIDIQPEAVTADAVFMLDPASESGQFVSNLKTSELTLMQNLPTDQFAYFALGKSFNVLAKSTFNAMPAPDAENEEEVKQFQELMKHEVEELAGAFHLDEGSEGTLRIVNFMRINNPDAYLSDIQKWIENNPHMESGMIQQDFVWTPDSETIDGVTVDKIQVTTTIDPQQDPSGMSNQMMKFMMGEEGMTQRFANVDGVVVQAIGPNQDVMQSALTALKSNTSLSENLTALEDQLGKPSQALVMFDLPRALQRIMTSVSEQGIVPIPAQDLKEISLSPTYAGAAIRSEGANITFRAVVPAEQINGLVTIGTALQQSSRSR